MGARGSGRSARLAARPSPPLALAALAVSRGHTLVSEAGFPPPPAFAPSCPWALRAGEQWKRGRPWCARGPGALAGRVNGTVRAPASRRTGDASQLRSRAVRPASAALPFLAGAGTRGGDQRPRRRQADPWPAPPSAGRADPDPGRRGGSTQWVSGVLAAASPRRRDFSRGGDSSLPSGAAASEPSACSVGAGRTMLSCQLVRASNLPSVKKDRRTDPVASLTFRGESPVAVAPVRPRHRLCARTAGSAAPAPALTVVQAIVSSPSARTEISEKFRSYLLPRGRGGCNRAR